MPSRLVLFQYPDLLRILRVLSLSCGCRFARRERRQRNFTFEYCAQAARCSWGRVLNYGPGHSSEILRDASRRKRFCSLPRQTVKDSADGLSALLRNKF
eukprot:6197801-Pleurochrysis_carterae.AAC.2